MRKFAWILAGLLALFTLTAAGYGARGLIRGKDIAPNSISTKHLTDHTIQMQDISAAALTGLRGRVGPTGPAGPAGPAGAAGPQGPAGIPGLQFVQAESAYDSSSPKSVQVDCPAGKRALSWSFSIVLAGTDYASTAPGLESVGPVDFDPATGKLPGAWIGKATEAGTYPNSWRLTMYSVCI